MATSQSEPRGTSLLAGTPAGTACAAPLSGGNPGISSPKRSFKTILEGGADIALEPMKVMDDPLDHPMDRSATRHGQVRDREFLNVPIRKDAADTSALGSGTTELAALQLNTEVILSSVADTNWEIAGTGDFDGDGDTDILWRYYGAGDYQGLNDIWFMNGTLFDGESVFSHVQDTNWRIVGTGDFDGDSDTDILWRYYGTGDYQGLNVVWFMNGPDFAGETVFSAVADTNWRIAGTGDFNSDGETDILWRYHGTGDYQGLNVVWFMNDTTFVGETVFSAVTDTNWEIAGTGDFNNDGQADILWRYYGPGAYQGLNVIWYMNGASFSGEEVFGAIPDTNWKIVNR
jgi:hypothetical protein